jgi:hypothetical protein
MKTGLLSALTAFPALALRNLPLAILLTLCSGGNLYATDPNTVRVQRQSCSAKEMQWLSRFNSLCGSVATTLMRSTDLWDCIRKRRFNDFRLIIACEQRRWSRAGF